MLAITKPQPKVLEKVRIALKNGEQALHFNPPPYYKIYEKDDMPIQTVESGLTFFSKEFKERPVIASLLVCLVIIVCLSYLAIWQEQRYDQMQEKVLAEKDAKALLAEKLLREQIETQAQLLKLRHELHEQTKELENLKNKSKR